MRNYLKIPFVKAIVKEIAYQSLKSGEIRHFFSKNQAMKNQFLRPNGVKIVSKKSQSVWNIIIDDQKHILDLIKSHKGHLKKVAQPRLKKIPIFSNFLKIFFWLILLPQEPIFCQTFFKNCPKSPLSHIRWSNKKIGGLITIQ